MALLSAPLLLIIICLGSIALTDFNNKPLTLVALVLTVFCLLTLVTLTRLSRSKKGTPDHSVLDYHLLFNATPDATLVCDKSGLILTCNHQVENLLGFKPDEVMNKPISFLIPERFRENHHKLYANYTEAPTAKPMGTGRSVKALKSNGDEIDVEVSLSPIVDKDNTLFACSIRDISERIKAEQTIHKLAYFDSLTDLPNRRYFLERLSQILSTNTPYYKALLFIDLDNFKVVNDTYGHDFGDELLKQIAGGIIPFLQKKDLVARLGGDEFVVVLNDIHANRSDAIKHTQKTADDIRVSIVNKIKDYNEALTCSASIGVCVFTGKTSVNKLLKSADTAMYEAKLQGKNKVCLHDEYA